MRRTVVRAIAVLSLLLAVAPLAAQIDNGEPCEEVCFMAFDEAFLRCNELLDNPNAAGNDPADFEAFEECMRAAEEALVECQTACLPEVDQCRFACRDSRAGALEACNELEDPAERDACIDETESGFFDCLRGCGASDDEICASQCENAFARALESCFEGDNGIDPAGNGDPLDDQCLERAHVELESCMLECEPDDGRPGPTCRRRCDVDFQLALLDCGDNADCIAAAQDAHATCTDACLTDDERCQRACFDEWREVSSTCDGLPDLAAANACRDAADFALAECLESCGITDTCHILCDIALQRAIEACENPNGVDPAGNVDGGFDPECHQRAILEAEVCAFECEEDDPGLCPIRCQMELELALLECQGDDACVRAAIGAQESCLTECGIDVPDIPDPDPCLSECEAARDEGIERCINNVDAAGNIGDDECIARVESAFVECIEACGVDVPDDPDIPNEPCVTACDAAFDAALSECVTAAGEVVEECIRDAETAYLGCLVQCGVELPDDPDLPGLPDGSCAAACDSGLLDGIFGCLDEATGELDVQCVLDTVLAYEDCRSECEQGEEDGVVAAVIRGRDVTDRRFLRGDSNGDGRINVSDPVNTLNVLFLQIGEIPCDDAGDANDDGRVDISDGVRTLNVLFSGSDPLPPPSGTPGLDPTPDGLTCS